MDKKDLMIVADLINQMAQGYTADEARRIFAIRTNHYRRLCFDISAHLTLGLAPKDAIAYHRDLAFWAGLRVEELSRSD